MTSTLLSGGAAAAATWWAVSVGLDRLDQAVPGAWELPPSVLDILSIACVLAVGVVAGAAAWVRTRARSGSPSPARTLAWDGQGWTCDGLAGRATVAVDLLDWMLVRFQPPEGAALWMPLSEAGTGRAWPAIRAALYWGEPPAERPVIRGQPTGSVS